MSTQSQQNKMIFDYKTVRGHFTIEIVEMENEIRNVYKDIRTKYSIKVRNNDDLNWNIKFADTRGRIQKVEEKEKLINKLVDEVKIRIDKDEQGDFYIGEPTLDLT